MKKLILLLLGVAIGFGLCYFYFNSNQTEETMAKPPKGVITPAEAVVLDTAFNKKHQLISDSLVKQPDNRSAWWSLQDLRDYLDYAEEQVANDKYTMDGVRVYLGSYPRTEKGEGYTTLFMVPTGNKTTSDGSMAPIQDGEDSGDIPGGPPLNGGSNGYPPNASYPNN